VEGARGEPVARNVERAHGPLIAEEIGGQTLGEEAPATESILARLAVVLQHDRCGRAGEMIVDAAALGACLPDRLAVARNARGKLGVGARGKVERASAQLPGEHGTL